MPRIRVRPGSAFAGRADLCDRRPIDTLARARNALARAASDKNAGTNEHVRAAVKRRYGSKIDTSGGHLFACLAKKFLVFVVEWVVPGRVQLGFDPCEQLVVRSGTEGAYPGATSRRTRMPLANLGADAGLEQPDAIVEGCRRPAR